ncbi:MAG: type I-E CRISPR-associated protein Cas6/Cse3/CasE [Bacteroidota bacterium]
MMYLSRLTLNPRNPGARRDAARPYGLHQTLRRSLDHLPDSERGPLLFRLEPERGPGGPVVLVQSAMEPQWDGLLANGYLLRADGPKPFTPSLTDGQRLRFRLLANPVKRVRVEGKKHAVRVPLTHPAFTAAQRDADPSLKGYLDWLNRQARSHGFQVVSVQDAPLPAARARPASEPVRKADIPHFGVRFDGLLQVADPHKLTAALRAGIGPAKAFGFGLLSVAPA